MKKFAIALNAGAPDRRNIMTSFFNGRDWAYWHWIDDFWIVLVPEDYTPSQLHNEIEELAGVGTPNILIFEFHSPISYWGRATNEAWDWLSHIGDSS